MSAGVKIEETKTELETLTIASLENQERVRNILSRVETLMIRLKGNSRDSGETNSENRKTPEGFVDVMGTLLHDEAELLGAIQYNLGILENII